MSNKLKKNKSKEPQKKVVKESDNPIVNFLEKRLENQSDRSPQKRKISSNCTYAFVEFLIFIFIDRIFLLSEEGYKYGLPFYFYIIGIIFAIYNIGISIYQIVKQKYKIKQNVALIIIQATLALIGIALLITKY